MLGSTAMACVVPGRLSGFTVILPSLKTTLPKPFFLSSGVVGIPPSTPAVMDHVPFELLQFRVGIDERSAFGVSSGTPQQERRFGFGFVVDRARADGPEDDHRGRRPRRRT